MNAEKNAKNSCKCPVISKTRMLKHHGETMKIS